MMNTEFRETGYRVPGKTRDQIRRTAHWLRDFVATNYSMASTDVDVVGLIQKWGRLRADGMLDNPDYRVVANVELPGRAAEFRPRGQSGEPRQDDEQHLFIVRESVWDGATAGDPDHRATLAHEIGHCVLQHPTPSYARIYRDERVDRSCDSEWQANTFMDEFLMDSRLISPDDGWGIVMTKFNVTEGAAVRRVRELMNERREKRWQRNL